MNWLLIALLVCVTRATAQNLPARPSNDLPGIGGLRLGSAPGTVRAERPVQDDDEQEGGRGRSFLFKEVVLSGFYSFDRVRGLPVEELADEYVGFSRRPPGNYIGLDYVRTFTASSPINKLLPDWLQATAMDLHPRVVYDRAEDREGFSRIKFAPQDFWLRFSVAETDRLTLRLGQFVIPFGANPILAPRQQFLLPLEAIDLGLKWDWGLNLKGPVGEYDWELALTIGSGEALHSPHIFNRSNRATYLITGRVGSPSYWDWQYGISFLYGDLPAIMGPRRLSDAAISRWRVGYDVFYRHGTYLMAGAQVTYGQDGFTDDYDPRTWQELAGPILITHGWNTANVLGLRAWADWVIPRYQDVRLALQFESIRRDVSAPGSDDTAIILEVGYSVTTAITARLDYREELNSPMGENDAVYLTVVFYGR